mmetsp:Transcript_40095/g.126589  ORF Transcript_40095/g.126589 Transcript_40095/m.126589 type:complete len:222 (+) Transcript_40095:177-842(+)
MPSCALRTRLIGDSQSVSMSEAWCLPLRVLRTPDPGCIAPPAEEEPQQRWRKASTASTRKTKYAPTSSAIRPLESSIRGRQRCHATAPAALADPGERSKSPPWLLPVAVLASKPADGPAVGVMGSSRMAPAAREARVYTRVGTPERKRRTCAPLPETLPSSMPPTSFPVRPATCVPSAPCSFAAASLSAAAFAAASQNGRQSPFSERMKSGFFSHSPRAAQ